MSHYDPYQRGQFPVGVQSRSICYGDKNRELSIEYWYPAQTAYQGQDSNKNTQDKFSMAPGFPETPQSAVRDAKAEKGKFPLIIFSHGFAGHRRQTTHLCCHLASHGYVVIAPDHAGNTLLDIMSLAGTMQGQGFSKITGLFSEFKADRPQDIIACIDYATLGELPISIDDSAIAVCGHSFGGWTSLASAIKDERIKAIVPLAPAGGHSQHAISSGMDFSLGDIHFKHTLPCLYLVADKDTLLPLDGMYDLYRKTPAPKRMMILHEADHFHFCDNVEFIHDAMQKMGSALFGSDNDTGVLSVMAPSSELCSGENAYAFIQSATLAHFDAHVRKLEAAHEFLETHLLSSLAEKHIKVSDYQTV